MGFFKRMKDPVRGTGEVVTQMAPLCGGSGELRLIVSADGVPPTPVDFSISALKVKVIARWPREHDVLPVTVDRANPQKVTIEWDEMPSAEERERREKDQATQERLDEMRGEDGS